MTVETKLIVMTCAVVLATSPASAQLTDFHPALNLSGLTIDLDSKEGRFSHVDFPVACGINAFRTRLSMPRIGLSSNWLPAAMVQVQSGEHWVGIQVGGARTFPMSIRLYTSASEDAQVLARRMENNQTLDHSAHWTPDGTVTFTIGGETVTAKLPGPVTALHFSSSTAEAKFDPLDIGRTGAAPADCPAS